MAQVKRGKLTMYFAVHVVYCVMLFYRSAVTQSSLSTVLTIDQYRAMKMVTFH